MIHLLPGYSKKYQKLFLVLGVLALVLPLPFHHRHDYGAFVTQWRAMLQGVNPWVYPNGVMTGNSYGPLFNFFQYLYKIYSHLPHLLFITSWLGLSAFVLRQYGLSTALTENEKKVAFWFLILNPFFWIIIVSYGHFDILIAIFILFALIFRVEKKYWQSGVLLAIGVLFKYIPVIILPFLSLERRRIKWSLVGSFAVIFLIGMGLAYLKWGSPVFYPFLFTKDRPSNFISIFRYLRGPYSPIPSQDGLSFWLMMGSWGALILIHWIFDLEVFFISIVAMMSVLLFSKLGHPQFYTPLFFMVPYWWLREKETYQKEGRREPNLTVLKCFGIQLLFLSFVKVIYAMTQGFKNGWEWLDDIMGLPAFIIGLACLIPIGRELVRRISGSAR